MKTVLITGCSSGNRKATPNISPRKAGTLPPAGNYAAATDRTPQTRYLIDQDAVEMMRTRAGLSDAQ